MKKVMKKALSLVLVLAMVFTLTPMIASAAELGDMDNPYQLTLESRLAVTVAPKETAFIQASAENGTVEVGYSTTTDWSIQYGTLPQVFPTAEGTATLALTGNNTFSVYNSSATESVTMYMVFAEGEAEDTIGTVENPEEVILEEDSWDGSWDAYLYRDLEEGNEGYYYTFTTPIDGKLRVRIGATDADKHAVGWTYCVNNETAGVYGDYHLSDDEVVVREEISEVKAGDKITVFAATYNPENKFVNPYAEVYVGISVYPLGSSDNPIEITTGSYTTIGVEYVDDVNYKYIATEAGTVTITMDSESGWRYSVYNATAYEYTIHYYYDDPVVAVETLEVAAGDEIEIVVNTYNSEEGMNIESVDWTLSFKSASDEEPDIEECPCDNIIHMEAVEPGCHYEGNIEYWYCADCDTVWADEALTQLTNHKNVILPELGGEVVHFDAVAPACHYEGNIEYWYCADCEQVWTDEALTQLSNRKNVILPATGSENLQHVEAVASTCWVEGNIEYWWCEDCEGFWTDEACTQLTNSKNVIVPAMEHVNVEYYEAVAPTCHDLGNVEHWFCPDCEGFWLDAALTQVTNSKSVMIAAIGSENMLHFDAVTPGCHSLGNMEYWYCADCDRYWLDEACTQLTNSKRILLPAVGSENLQHVEATVTCFEEGNVEYWFCPDCEGYWLDEACTRLTNSKSVNVPAIGHANVVHFEAVDAACHYDGNIEYWFCPDCEGFWQDEALTQVTNAKRVIISALGGETVYFEAIEPSCHYNGNIEYWYCADCEQYWQDKALTQLTNSKNIILPAIGSENVIHFEAIASACHYEGNIEYWYCADCEQYWQNEALTQLTNSKNVILPAIGSENVIHFDAIAPGCHYDGNIEYWYCADCEQFWQDKALTQLTNSKNIILSATGSESLVHVEAVENTCWAEGNIEYWYCEECEQFWQDEALTQLTNSKNVMLPAIEHANLVHFDAIEPGCHYNGNIEYWFCPDCEGFWTDEALTQVTNSKSIILPAVYDTLTDGDADKDTVLYFEAVAPGCHSLGNIEYWYCPECEQYWQDEALTQVTNSKNVILPELGSDKVLHSEAVEPGCHSLGFAEYWYCADCNSYYLDEACTRLTNYMSTFLPAIGSENVTHVAAVAPTYDKDGNIEYWYCADCDTYYVDEACTQLTNALSVILPKLEAPETDEPDVPVVPDEPETDEPDVPVVPDEPGTDEPDVPVVPDEPETDEPDVPEPGTDVPGEDEPGTDVPGGDEPGTDVPGEDEPGTDVPGEDEPGTDVPSKPEVVLPPVSNEEVTDEIGANSAPSTVDKETIVEVEEAVAELIQKIENVVDKVVTVITQAVAPEMTEDLFAAAKDNDKDITIGVVNENNQLMYSWTFAGSEIDMNKVTKPMDLTISFATDKQAEIEQVTGKDNGIYIAINGYEGELPAPATVKTYVGENFANGAVVYLYYYNEATQAVELTGNSALTVNGGYVEYVLEHCSIYFISENTPAEYGLEEPGADEPEVPGTPDEPGTDEPEVPGTEEPDTEAPSEPETPETSDYLADMGFFWAILGFAGIALLALHKKVNA